MLANDPKPAGVLLVHLGQVQAQLPIKLHHLDRSKLLEDTVKELCFMLAPGVVALCKAAGVVVPSALKKTKKK